MFKFEIPESENSRQKVDFPVDLAVSNVTLRSIEKNEKILGVRFNFQRIDGDTISWLTDTILPPNESWFKDDKIVNDKTITPQQQYISSVNSFMGYIRHILIAADVDVKEFANISGETIEELVDNIVSTINPLIDTSATFYLKTVKDKNGYTKLPGFKGTGVAQSTKAGYPIKHVYTPYETSLINLSKKEGVTDLTNSDTTVEDGLDF